MNRSEKNNPVCKFWLKFPKFVAKRVVKYRGGFYKKGNFSIKINEANSAFETKREILEEFCSELVSSSWLDGTLGAWRLPGRLAFF